MKIIKRPCRDSGRRRKGQAGNRCWSNQSANVRVTNMLSHKPSMDSSNHRDPLV